MTGGSKTGCFIALKGCLQLHLCLPQLLLLGSLCSHETGVKIGCFVGSARIVGILTGEKPPTSFQPRLLCLLAMGSLQGLSNSGYRVTLSHFSPCKPP